MVFRLLGFVVEWESPCFPVFAEGDLGLACGFEGFACPNDEEDAEREEGDVWEYEEEGVDFMCATFGVLCGAEDEAQEDAPCADVRA